MRRIPPKSKTRVKVRKRPALTKKITKKEKEIRPTHLIGLENLKPPVGAHRKKKLLGRGPSSGHGKTSTRGIKGQTSRAGRDFYLGFEGGQMPLIRKIPKRGFTNIRFKKIYQIVNIGSLAKIKEQIIEPQLLEQKGLIKDKNKLIKILGQGELTKSLTIKAHAFSKRAKELIEAVGGKVEVINV